MNFVLENDAKSETTVRLSLSHFGGAVCLRASLLDSITTQAVLIIREDGTIIINKLCGPIARLFGVEEPPGYPDFRKEEDR